ncbi:MAG: hypothetical protein ACYTG1_02800 [Planctomycetota bacterium]|jgi:hypothetical protein
MHTASGLALVCLAAGCATSGGEPSPAPAPEPSPFFVLEHDPADAGPTATVAGYLADGRADIESFFGAPLAGPVTVRVLPSRAAFTEYARAAWGLPATQCWMVGAAETRGLVLLSPRVWRTDACEHDPDDPTHVRDLVVHELVHVHHMDVNPSDEFAGVTDIDWLVEGLAVYVSGQLDRGHRARAREAVATGTAPARLAEAWTGPYRYGVSGSMVEFVDDRWGRAVLCELLAATGQAAVLARLDVSEAAFIDAWRGWLVEG